MKETDCFGCGRPPLGAGSCHFVDLRNMHFRRWVFGSVALAWCVAAAVTPHVHAADVFVAPGAADLAASVQEQRTARLEAQLKAALEKLDKLDSGKEAKAAGDVKSGSDESKQPTPIPMPLPSPFLKGSMQGLGVVPAPLVDVERVIGVMNGQEIYVLEGVVRQRDVSEPAAKQQGGKR